MPRTLQMNSKYDPDLASMCLEWMKDSINHSPEGPVMYDTCGDPENFAEVLHDGTVLAKYVNCAYACFYCACVYKELSALATNTVL